MDDFVKRENLLRFAEALSRETDMERRDVLHNLFADEAMLFQRADDRLQVINTVIHRSRENIGRQRDVIDQLRSLGHDIEGACRTLTYMRRTHSMFEIFRRLVCAGAPPREAPSAALRTHVASADRLTAPRRGGAGACAAPDGLASAGR